MNKHTHTKELLSIIVKAIREEPFFNEDILIPKIDSLIKIFRIRVSSDNYHCIENPTKTAKLMRVIERAAIEKREYLDELKKHIDNKQLLQMFININKKLDVFDGITIIKQ